MTQEDKELLLKDLCARLPYGVIVNVKGFDYDYNDKLTQIYKGVGCSIQVTTNMPYDIEQVKPYLFPLSNMTLEQRCKLQDLLPNNCDISFKNQKITFYNEGNIRLEQLEKLFHFFNLFHLDYRGLIPKGLALDATGLNIY